MYIHDVYHMLPDKMAISHSSHLFVPVAFVFCLLLLLIHASDLYDYTDSKHFKKNPTISKHRNNIQRLPNYNWKPSDKYYGPRKESTEKNLKMEFTKPDPEQRMVDPWIKKMQEISRQEREKWAAYRRNVKLTLDNVEETTKARKLTNESITIPMLSKNKEYHENIKERSEFPIKLFEKSESLEANMELDPTISKLFVKSHSSVEQDSADVKDDSFDNQFHDSSWTNSKQSADTNVDKASNKKLKSDEWNTDIKNSSRKLLRKATHQRHKDYEIFDIKEESSFKQNAATDYEKSELEEDRPSSIINSHPEKSISQQFKDSHILKNNISTHKNFTKFSENDKNLNHINNSKKSLVKKYSRQFNSSRDNKKESTNKKNQEKTANSMQKSKNDNVNSHSEESILQQSKTPHVPKSSINKNLEKFSRTNKNLNHTDSKLFVKKYPRQSSTSQNDNEKNNEDNKDNEKTIIAKSLMWKNKEEKDARGKDVTEKLNHERSFHSGRWGMSVSSPPTEFLKDMSRRSKHRKNKEQTEKNGKHHLFDRWGMSVTLPPKEFFKDIFMHRGRGTERFTMKTRSRPNEIKGSSNNRLPIHQNRQNLQRALAQQLRIDERYKKLAEILLGKVSDSLYDSRYPNLNYWNNHSTNTDLNNDLFLKFLQALRSYVWQNDMDIPMTCRIRIPYASVYI